MMKEELEEVVSYRGYEIGIFQDEDTEDPRSWDNLGTMACWHSRYNLGDEQPGWTPDEYMEALDEQAVVLPLYLYDHSGVTMRTTPFTCPFDSGQVGFIHVSKEEVRSQYEKKRISAKLLGLVKTISGGPFCQVPLEDLEPTFKFKVVLFWNWADHHPEAHQGTEYYILRPLFRLKRQERKQD